MIVIFALLIDFSVKPSKNESGSKRSAPKQKMNKTVKVPGTQKSKTQLSATKMLRRKKVKHLEKLVKYYINRVSYRFLIFARIPCDRIACKPKLQL